MDRLVPPARPALMVLPERMGSSARLGRLVPPARPALMVLPEKMGPSAPLGQLALRVVQEKMPRYYYGRWLRIPTRPVALWTSC